MGADLPLVVLEHIKVGVKDRGAALLHHDRPRARRGLAQPHFRLVAVVVGDDAPNRDAAGAVLEVRVLRLTETQRHGLVLLDDIVIDDIDRDGARLRRIVGIGGEGDRAIGHRRVVHARFRSAVAGVFVFQGHGLAGGRVDECDDEGEG